MIARKMRQGMECTPEADVWLAFQRSRPFEHSMGEVVLGELASAVLERGAAIDPARRGVGGWSIGGAAASCTGPYGWEQVCEEKTADIDRESEPCAGVPRAGGSATCVGALGASSVRGERYQSRSRCA